jgi:putative membrane protein
MKRILLLLIFGFLAALFEGCDPRTGAASHDMSEEHNEENSDTKTKERLAEFLASAVESKYADLKLAELASIKSDNSEIQNFAQSLANDHTNTLTELQALADKKGIRVPVEEGEDTKEKINKLSKEKNSDFDKKWCNELIAKHKKAIREFELMSDRSDDPQLQEVINRSLIDLRAKLEKLNALEKDTK